MERTGNFVEKVEYRVQEYYKLTEKNEMVVEWRATVWSDHDESSSVTGAIALAFNSGQLDGPDEITTGVSPVHMPSRVLEKMALQAEHDKDAIVRQMEEGVEE